MSDSTTPGEHPAFPPAQPTNPQYSPPPASPASPPSPQYPGTQQPYQQHPGTQQPYQQHPGTQQPYQQHPAQQYAPARPTSGLAVTSLVTGIAGVALSWLGFPLLASIAAVITGHMALGQTRRNPALAGRGMAIAGLILGYAGIAIIVFGILAAIVSFLFIGTIPFLLYGVGS